MAVQGCCWLVPDVFGAGIFNNDGAHGLGLYRDDFPAGPGAAAFLQFVTLAGVVVKNALPQKRGFSLVVAHDFVCAFLRTPRTNAEFQHSGAPNWRA